MLAQSHAGTTVIVLPTVYVINLERRPDRWQKVRQRIEAHFPPYFSVQRVNAIDGIRSVDIESTKTVSKTEQALTKTFLNLFRSLAEKHRIDKDKQTKWVVVLEDDVFFHKNFSDLFEGVKKNLSAVLGDEKNSSKSIPYLYLGATEILPENKNWLQEQRAMKDCVEFRKPAPKTFGAFAILYNLDAICTLLIAHYEKECSRLACDNILHQSVRPQLDEQKWLSPIVCYPNIVIADVSESDQREGCDQRRFSARRHWDLELYDLD